jgi:hypothetical protein
MICVFKNGFGLNRALPSSTLLRRELRENPLPDIEISRMILARCVADCELWRARLPEAA